MRRSALDLAGALLVFVIAVLVLSHDAGAGALHAPFGLVLDAQAGVWPVEAGIAFDLTESADRTLLTGIMALFFAALCAVTLGLWRRLRREDASPRRFGRRT